LDVAHDELVVLVLLVAVGSLVVLASLVRVPYPIFLVVGGLVLGFVPGLPELELDPDLVLVAFLPPLLYSAAFFNSLRDLRANVRPISLLALGLVGATTLAVAAVAHTLVDGLTWPAAFVLGAIVSPTDPIAATAIASKLGIPGRVVTIVEGESLVNDGSALVLYRFAAAAVVTGTFSLAEAGLRFVLSAVGGVLIGLAVARIVAAVRRRLDNPPVEITISLLTGYLAYLPAEALGVSGVLAAVTVGIAMGVRAPELTTPAMRLQSVALWEVVVFVVNSLLFVLVGLQLPPLLDELGGRSAGELALVAAAVTGTVILVRLAWVFLGQARRRAGAAPWQETLLVGWMGMRGAVSLAAALALPLGTDSGSPFPERDLIIFLAFCVIFGTLVLQGLSLGPLIRALDVRDDGRLGAEETEARRAAAEAALGRLEELEGESWVRDDTAERLRGLYGFRRRRFEAGGDGGDGGSVERRSRDYQRLRRELFEAERAAILRLRDEGRINDETMRRIERDLDLEDVRLDL